MDITMEGVLTLVASLTGADKEELVTSTNDKEITTIDELKQAIKPIVSAHAKNYETHLKKEAHRKTLAKAEKIIKEVFPDLESKRLEDIATELQTKINKPVKAEKAEVKESDIQRYLASEKGLKFIEESNEKYAKSKIERINFEKSITDEAVAAIEQQGGQFSKTKSIRERQIRTLKRELLDSYKFKKEGESFVPIDEDGEQLFNESSKKLSSFVDIVTQLSPVDIVTETKPTVTQPNIPSARGVLSNPNANNFGYSSEQLKNISIIDYNKAVAEGNIEKQSFISEALKAKASAESEN